MWSNVCLVLTRSTCWFVRWRVTGLPHPTTPVLAAISHSRRINQLYKVMKDAKRGRWAGWPTGWLQMGVGLLFSEYSSQTWKMTKRPSLNGNLTQICPLAVRLEEDLKIEKYKDTSLGNLNGIISNYYLYTNIPQRHTHARTHVYVVRVRMCERECVWKCRVTILYRNTPWGKNARSIFTDQNFFIVGSILSGAYQ